MKRRKLAILVEGLLSHNKECSVSIDVWHPTFEDIKYILKLGHDKVDPNNSSESCNIYSVEFEYRHSGGPGLRAVLFCDELEGKFMYEYTKQRKEVNK